MNWAIIWLALLIGFVVVEAACPFHLVSIWFAAGSLISMIAALLNAPIWLQITLFLVVSGGLLALMMPLVRKFLRPKMVKTNVDAVIGSEGYVTADIDNLSATGQIRLGGMEWTARSTTGEKIPAGTLVKVDRIEGVKAFVTAVKVSAEV
jgi:membrane protein implicated in regulation of membrane protease activity